MNAAARATIASLISAGEVERVPVDQAVVTNLLRQASNHLRTAAAGADADDPEGAFQLACDACRKTSLALVMATGLRPKGQSAHVITFDAAAAIASNFGAARSSSTRPSSDTFVMARSTAPKRSAPPTSKMPSPSAMS